MYCAKASASENAGQCVNVANEIDAWAWIDVESDVFAGPGKIAARPIGSEHRSARTNLQNRKAARVSFVHKR